jgi:hypothetical protein
MGQQQQAGLLHLVEAHRQCRPLPPSPLRVIAGRVRQQQQNLHDGHFSAISQPFLSHFSASTTCAREGGGGLNNPLTCGLQLRT